MLLVPRTDAGHADDEQGHNLAVKQMAVLVDIRKLYPAVDVRENATPERQHSGGDGIFEEFDNQRQVDERPENLVDGLQVLAFFHCILLR